MWKKNNDIIKYDDLLILYVNLTDKIINSYDFRERIQSDGYKIKNTFLVNKKLTKGITEGFYIQNDIKQDSEEEFCFIISKLENDYYKIDSEVLDIEFDLYFYKDTKLDIKCFVANQNISIFSYISALDAKHSIYIGGQENNLPHNSFYLSLEEFTYFISNFPNSTEIKHYRRARIAKLVREYFDIPKDFEKKFQTYINKKSGLLKSPKAEYNSKAINDNECHKYQYILNILEEMLKNDCDNEKQWQKKINDILKLLFPKYVLVLEEACIKTKNNEKKRVDYLCVDMDGYVDIIELKLPNNCLKIKKYRDNYVPSGELSNSVMQIEKYIFILSDNSIQNIEFLNKQYKEKLEPLNLKIKIINPRGFLIIGRDVEEIQKHDFELIKRHYKNVVDVLTYDDLIRRLKVLVKSFKYRVVQSD